MDAPRDWAGDAPGAALLRLAFVAIESAKSRRRGGGIAGFPVLFRCGNVIAVRYPEASCRFPCEVRFSNRIGRRKIVSALGSCRY